MEILELNYLDLEENKNYEKIIKKVLQKCFEEENLQDKKLYVNVVLTNDENIRNINREHRQIDLFVYVLCLYFLYFHHLLELHLHIIFYLVNFLLQSIFVKLFLLFFHNFYFLLNPNNLILIFPLC